MKDERISMCVQIVYMHVISVLKSYTSLLTVNDLMYFKTVFSLR